MKNKCRPMPKNSNSISLTALMTQLRIFNLLREEKRIFKFYQINQLRVKGGQGEKNENFCLKCV